MRKFLLGVCVALLSVASSFAEKPMVTCPYCSGSGQFQVGYMSTPCISCKGTGKIVDPYYQGKTMMAGMNACSKGKQKLYEGDYSGAVNAFREAYRADIYEAATFLGFCAELGMGLAVDHQLAWDLYTYAGNHGDIAGKGAIARINEDGYWPARMTCAAHSEFIWDMFSKNRVWVLPEVLTAVLTVAHRRAVIRVLL